MVHNQREVCHVSTNTPIFSSVEIQLENVTALDPGRYCYD